MEKFDHFVIAIMTASNDYEKGDGCAFFKALIKFIK
jgi:hypothetical protein